MKRDAIDTGALGCSLSGSGPSVFALCRDLAVAERVSKTMADAFADAAGLETDRYVSRIDPAGARVEAEACDT